MCGTLLGTMVVFSDLGIGIRRVQACRCGAMRHHTAIVRDAAGSLEGHSVAALAL